MNTEQTVSMKLVNFRMPFDMKDAFWMVCKYNGTDMSRVLTGLVKEYINEETPKLRQYRHNAISIGNSISPLNNIASKPSKKMDWHDVSESEEKPIQRQGQWGKNPTTKTWEIME